MSKSNPSFLKRNLVTIIVVPGLIGAHYGWWKLQQIDALVPEHERTGLPIVEISKKIYQKITGSNEIVSTNSAKK